MLETTAYLEVVNSNAAVPAAGLTVTPGCLKVAIAAIAVATANTKSMRLIKRNLLSCWGSLLELPHPVSAARLPPYYRGP